MTERETLTDKLVEGYNRMLERVHQAVDQAKGAGPSLGHGIDAAMQKASELGELTREEAERVGDYLRRDLHDAAAFINKTGSELKDWLNFDVEVVEREMAKRFAGMVDHTQLELDKIEQMANKIGEWHTGEVVSIGTLECKACGEVIHFHRTGHIPPCPKCRGTKFRRLSSREE